MRPARPHAVRPAVRAVRAAVALVVAAERVPRDPERRDGAVAAPVLAADVRVGVAALGGDGVDHLPHGEARRADLWGRGVGGWGGLEEKGG